MVAGFEQQPRQEGEQNKAGFQMEGIQIPEA
jgi:hypothetical protein